MKEVIVVVKYLNIRKKKRSILLKVPGDLIQKVESEFIKIIESDVNRTELTLLSLRIRRP
jgi:hypothetical protein